jgi:chemotaxis protein CheZ
MMSLEKEDWNELVKLLRGAEESISAMSVGDGEQQKEKSRQFLTSFHTTAAMFGLEDLAKAGVELEKFLTSNVSPGGVDSIAVLGFAISSLVDQMRGSGNGNGKGKIDLNELREILGPSEEDAPALDDDEMPGGVGVESSGKIEAKAEAVREGEEIAGLNSLSELVRSWGGELSVVCDSPSECNFHLTFRGSAETLQTIESLLCSADAGEREAPDSEEAKLDKLLEKGKEFMQAFADGDVSHAQEVLLDLADQQSQPSVLYKEVGSLARGLHDSIRGFLNNLEPSLKDMVEDKLPDSGNRLEHMMEMTERSAITTLDHVEAMQDRLAGELELISELRSLMGGLNAIGDSAEKKLARGNQALDTMESIIGQHRSDLDIIMTAQDYQDLSGQIILKITQLLHDIQSKLVNLIRTFGVKADTNRQKTNDNLYGPAHAAVPDAVQSQDEVDSLLAEFGF